MSNCSNNHIKSKFKITKKKVLVILLLFTFICASVPTILLLKKIFFPKDNSTEFILLYDGADPDFSTIDYSGIEYFVDGTAYYTDSSGIISIVMNDNEEHIFQIIWHGVLYEKIFNTSISEEVLLATKSIDALVLWNEIFVPALNNLYSDFDLYYWNGISWIIIQTAFTDVTGMIAFSSLVHGLYALSEAGDNETLLTFELDQLTIIYTENILAEPDTIIIDIDYLNTFLGTDYPIDLTTIAYALEIYSTTQKDWITVPESLYVALVIDEASGMIVFYEYTEESSNKIRIVIGNAWNVNYEFSATDTLIEIDLVAKSLDASYTWSSDGSVADGETVTLYYWNGIGWINVGSYITNVEGKVIITEMLPIGQYMFDSNPVFEITADDILKTVAYTVESILGERTVLHLDFIVGVKSKFFLFYVIKKYQR